MLAAMQPAWWPSLTALLARPGAVQAWTDPRAWPVFHHIHLHPNPTVILALSGIVHVRGVDQAVALAPGDLLVVGTGVWHEHLPLRAGACWVGLGFLPGWADLALTGGEAPWLVRADPAPLRPAVEGILAARSAGARQQQAEGLRRALAAADGETVPIRVGVPAALSELLWKRYVVRTSAGELVSGSGASRATTYRQFTKLFGLPPRAFISHARLELAAALLGHGISVRETAWRCGYPSPDTFTRCWKRAHGAPPSAGT